MSTRKERRDRSRLRGVCRNCGEKGRHFAPPGFGTPGMYVCKPKAEGPATHDPRCISLTDSEFNDHCDCRTLAMIDDATKGPTT